jgi:hypothetical protein
MKTLSNFIKEVREACNDNSLFPNHDAILEVASKLFISNNIQESKSADSLKTSEKKPNKTIDANLSQTSQSGRESYPAPSPAFIPATDKQLRYLYSLGYENKLGKISKREAQQKIKELTESNNLDKDAI